MKPQNLLPALLSGLSLALCLAPAPARADMDIPIQLVTSYAGGNGYQSCQYDPYGGGPKGITALGDMAVRHTVDGRRDGGYAVAAVPQRGGGAASILGCYFRDDKNYPGVRFRASDTYGAGSNGKLKYDASHACTPRVKHDSKPRTSIMVIGKCGGKRGGPGKILRESVPQQNSFFPFF